MNQGLSIPEAENLLRLLGLGEQADRIKQLQGKVSREVRIVGAPSGVAAYVTPDRDRMIYMSWHTALFGDVDFTSDVLKHEDIHLRHKEMWDMEIPFLNRLQSVHFRNIVNTLGFNPLGNFTELLEGFTEGSLTRKRGHADRRIAYAHHEVPMVEKFDALIKAKSGGSLLDDFGRMSSASRLDFLRHFRTATNVMMLEQASFGKIDPDLEAFPAPGLQQGDFQGMCAWYEKTFPDYHVIETAQEAKGIRDSYDQIHGLALAA